MKGTLRLLLPMLVLSLVPALVSAQGNPVPSLSGVSPGSALAGGGSFTVTVSGANFIPSFSAPGSVVQWNGSARPTTYVNAGTLLADISGSDIAQAGSADITVSNPGPGGGTSKPFTFTIIAGNPAPTILSLSPSTATAGGGAFSLTVNGSNFISQSTVYWNGDGRPTTFVNGSTLTASITATDIAKAGSALVSVVSPSPGGGGTSTLSFTIVSGGAGKLEVLPGVLNIQALNGGPKASQSLHIGNSGGGLLSWTATASIGKGGNWLSLSAASGAASGPAPSVVQVNADPTGLGSGLFTGNITVKDVNGDGFVVLVNFTVLPGAPVLQLSHAGLRFAAQTGGIATPSQTFSVHNVGTSSLNWNATISNYTGTTIPGTPSWLSLSPSSGTAAVGAPSTVTVNANPTGLTAGTYYAEIRVTSGAVNAPQSIMVVMTITGNAPPAQVGPLGLIFVARAGGGVPAQQQVGIGVASTLGGTLTVTTANGVNWLDAQPRNFNASPTGGQNVTVAILIGLLVPAVYPATVTFNFTDGTSQTVNVQLLVTPSTSPVPEGVWVTQESGGTAAACSPARLLAVTRVLGGGFSSPAGWPQTIEVLAVDDCGNPATGATVVASFSNGDPPLVLNGVGGGIYTGTWKPSTAASATTVTVHAGMAPLGEATLQVQGTVSGNPGVPLVAQGGVVNGASFAKNQAVAPGSIVSVFGVAMADKTPGGAVSLPLPTVLGGATIMIGGISAPLYYSSDGQINAQIPYEVQANTRMGLLVQLSLPGLAALSLPEPVTLDVARPGVFLANTQGQGVVIDTQGRVVDGNAPAAAGDVVVVYATGLGATVPAAQTGRPAPTSPLAQVTPLPTVTVGGVAAGVQFAGLTPGLVGLYQVNVQIPSGVQTGAAIPLVITQYGVPSATVTIGVR